jgi:3-oxoacyl-[acyl-carrier-protein] synthase-3
MVIVATLTPDTLIPSTGAILQHRLGARKAAAMDLEAACTGFVYALSTADAFIRTGAMSRILVVGAEVLSRWLDWTDRGTCILFGDGAGAAVLEADTRPGILRRRIERVVPVHSGGREPPPPHGRPGGRTWPVHQDDR